MPEWEKINESTERLSTVGGWIYRSWVNVYNDEVAEKSQLCMTFVPDPQRWRTEIINALKRFA